MLPSEEYYGECFGKSNMSGLGRWNVKSRIGLLGVAFLLLINTWSAARGQMISLDAPGWVDLFPSASLKKWTRIPIPPTKPLDPVSQWHVDPVNRVIICDGDRGHEWLRYNHQYKDFIFHVEWRFFPVEGKKAYNSGVFVRNNADGSVWYQAQVGNESYLFGDNPVDGGVKRFNLRAQGKAVKPAGEWNTFDVRCQGHTITLWLNGVLSGTLTDAMETKGFVGLEAEGYKIEFRNLKLKKLSGKELRTASAPQSGP